MTSSDDIITRLRAEPGPDGCYYCGEYGCANEDGDKIPWYAGTYDNPCACTCHTWLATVADAADEIEYLRQICEELMHAIECPNPACTLDWDGIHNWHDYRDQLAGRNKDNQ